MPNLLTELSWFTGLNMKAAVVLTVLFADDIFVDFCFCCILPSLVISAAQLLCQVGCICLCPANIALKLFSRNVVPHVQ